MTQPVSFQETTLGRGRTTDGLWLHRGLLTVGGSVVSPVWTGGQPLSVYGQGLFMTNPPPLNGGSYHDGQLHLMSQTPNLAMLGFHEAGSSALALYKPQGSNTQLRIRGNDNSDAAIAMSPTQALVGSWFGASAYAVPQAAIWTETDVRANYTGTGATVRFEVSCVVTSTPGAPAGSAVYMGLGIDGSCTWPSMSVVSIPTPGYASAMSAFIYHQTAAAGPHRVSIWLYVSTAGNGFTGGVNHGLWVTEQRA